MTNLFAAMYNFVFYFIYKRSLTRDGKFVARYSACLIVAAACGTFLGFLYSVARFILCYFWTISIARTTARASNSDNLQYLLFTVSLCGCVLFYFNERRVAKIVDKYEKYDDIYSLINFLKFFSIIFLPLLGAIYLVNKSVLYC